MADAHHHCACWDLTWVPRQPATQPVLADDGQPQGGAEWPEATAGSQNRSADVDYDALDAAVARYFEDPALVQGAKTRAVVVIYKARTACCAAVSVHCQDLV